MTWFRASLRPQASDHTAHAQAILGGIARSGPAGKPVLERLVRGAPLAPEPTSLVAALALAARAQGCPGVADPTTVQERFLKHMPEPRVAEERTRARLARDSVLRSVRACYP